VSTTKLIENEHGGVQRVGRYDLIAEIASGGMATVYLARLSGVGGFQRNVAIKCLHPHLAKNDEFVEMFLDEARLAALIHHPNVVPIQEVGEGTAGFYLVMDYVEGDTFAALLSRAAMEGKEVPREVSLRIVIDMLSGLHAAHELKDDHGRVVGLVHRDVSPQNVLVGTDGVTRITDFGVARAASRLSATRAGQLKGKLAYMAPEQAHGDEEVDRRADVFSAGVVLWEALALKRLFKAGNEAATLNRVLNDRIVSPREFSPVVSEEVAAVCLKALNRDLGARYVSCAEFGDALERAATAAQCIATGREVATYVNEVVGASIESHRRAIREWLEKRASEPPTPASSIRAPGFAPPPPPSRRPGFGAGGLNDTSAITQASGVSRASLRPPPPTAGVVGSRLASQAARPDGAPSGIVSKALPPLVSIPVHSVGTMVSAAPLVAPPKKKWPLVVGVLAAIGAAAAAGAALVEPDPAPPAALPVATTPAPMPTKSVPPPEPPVATSPVEEKAARAKIEALDAEELPEADSDGDEQAKSAKAAKRPRPKPRNRPAARAKPTPAPAKRVPANLDLENPYK
jgi:serine/threonine-protein kinase